MAKRKDNPQNGWFWPPNVWWVPIVVAVIGLSAPIIEKCRAAGFQFTIKVQIKGTNEDISNAKVMLEVIGQAPLDAVTDSNGYARVFIDNDRASKPGKLIVQATGYKKYVRNIDLNPMKLPDVVQLEPEITAAVPNDTEPATSPTPVGGSITSANDSLNDKWEITENQQLRQMGRIIINLSEGAPVKIYRQGQKKAFGFVNNNEAFELFSGQYEVKIHQAVVSGVPVNRGKDTRIRTGTLRITVDATNWIIYDESKEIKVVFGYGSKEIGLPIGRYYIEMNDDYEMIEVRNNQITEF